jgi:signal transduction histidine kinase
MTKQIAQRKLRMQLAALKQQRELDKERQRISREMHDDIGAGLTQITLMTESIKNKSTGLSSKDLDDITSTSRKLVNNMSEIIWSLNTENKSLDQFCAYLREELNKQLEYAGVEYTIQLPENREDIVLSNEQRRNLLLITKEIVNNAIKHSKAKNISVLAGVNANQLFFEIADNGCGFDMNKNYSGNGLKNMRNRIEELGGSFEAESKHGQGSQFKYFISLKSTI